VQAHRPPYAYRITDLADQHDTPSDASQPSLALLAALMKSRG
jgi:hypothetical protein